MPPVIISALAVIGVTGTAATIAASVATLALSYAVNAAMASAQQRQARKKARRDYQPPTQSMRGSVQPRYRHYGRVGKIGGYVAFAENIQYDVFLVLAYGTGTITAFDEFYVADKQVLLNAGGMVTNAPYWTGTPPTFSSVIIEPHRGYATQDRSIMIGGHFPQWTTAHRLNGVPYCAVHFRPVTQDRFQTVYNGAIPDVTVVLSGAALYDPRNPAHDPANSAAYEFSDNAALSILDYYISGDGMGIGLSAIDLASFREAADDCDDLLPLASGGVEKRYRISESYSFDEEPAAVLARMLESCGGETYLTRAGQIGLRVARPRVPAITITDDVIVTLSYKRGAGLLTNFNALVPKFKSVAHGWQIVEGSAIVNAEAVEELGREIRQENDLPNVLSATQAQRLSKYELYRDNPTYTGEIVCQIPAIEVAGEPLFRIVSESRSVDMVARATGIEVSDDWSRVTIRFESFDPKALEWDPEIDEQPAPAVPVATTDDPTTPGPPYNFSVVRIGGASPIAGVRFSVQQRHGQVHDIRWRKVGEAWTTITTPGRALVIDPAEIDAAYEVEARVRTAEGGISTWAPFTFVMTDAAPPTVDPPTIVSAVGGAGALNATFTQTADVDAWGLEWIATAVDGTVDWSAPNVLYPMPGETVSGTSTLPPGDYLIRARAFALDPGIVSSAAGPVAVTVSDAAPATGSAGDTSTGGGTGVGQTGGATGTPMDVGGGNIGAATGPSAGGGGPTGNIY